VHVPYAQPAMLKVGIKSPGAILRGFCVSPVGESPKLQISWSPRQKGVQFRCGQEKYSILFVFRTLPVSPMLSGLYGMPKTQLLQSLNLPYRYGGGGQPQNVPLEQPLPEQHSPYWCAKLLSGYHSGRPGAFATRVASCASISVNCAAAALSTGCSRSSDGW